MSSNKSFVRVLKIAAAFLAISAFGSFAWAQNPMTGAPTPAPQSAAQPPSAVPAQAPGAAAPAQTASVCSNQPLCYESQDFVATVTDFRTSAAGYRRVIDTTIRFQNKTNSPLALGYANGTGAALDDRGIRYAVAGGNALSGMGYVNGQTADAKFVLRPGGFGDVRFELLTGAAQVYCMSFELDLSVNEITLLEGNQHTVGAEFPLQFQGLVNGSHGAAPGIPSGGFAGISGMMSSAGSQTCGAAGTLTNVASATNNAGAQNAANTATSAVSTTTAAVNSLKSLFKHKPAATDPAQTAAVSAPCVPATPAAVLPSSVNPSGVAVVTNAVKSTTPPATAAAAATTTTTATTTATAPAKKATPTAKPATAAKPVVKKPAPAARPAPAPAA